MFDSEQVGDVDFSDKMLYEREKHFNEYTSQ